MMPEQEVQIARRNHWRRQRKLHLIWRAIARRRAEALDWVVSFHNSVERQRQLSQNAWCCNVCGYPRGNDNDGESDP